MIMEFIDKKIKNIVFIFSCRSSFSLRQPQFFQELISQNLKQYNLSK